MTTTRTGRGRSRRALDGAIALSAVIFAGVGLWLSVVDVLVIRELPRYVSAPTCARLVLALTADNCVVMSPATVDSAVAGMAAPDVVRPVVTVDSAALGMHRLSLEIRTPTRSFYQLRPTQPVSLKLWHGQVTAVYPSPGDALRTSASPYVQNGLDLSSGLFFLGMGVALILIRPPRALAARLSRQTALPHEADLSGSNGWSFRRLWIDPPMRIGLVSFLFLQVLDIATSVWDSSHGFYEANPLAVRLIDGYGPLAALVGIKLPAAIAFTLALTRLRRGIGIVVAFSGVAVMVYIVVQNVVLGTSAGAA